MPVLDRDALDASPLADLHLLANELGVDGFRRLRRAELIDAIVGRQGGDTDGAQAPAEDEEDAKPRRRSRGGRGRSRSKPADEESVEVAVAATEEPEAPEDLPQADQDEDEDEGRGRRRRGRRGGRSRAEEGDEPERSEERIAEGEVELVPNGSGFLRVQPGETTDEDVYISAAQVKRCELVAGDKIAGPVRAPRRSERHPSLVRIDTINGRPADEVAEGTRFDELPAAFPAQRLELGTDDPTLQAIDSLTPFGLGSRVTISGSARAGKSETLRRIAGALAGREGLEVSLVLAGVRPEELAEWSSAEPAPQASLSFAASPDQQAGAVEQALELARRIASRGGDAVVLIDTLDFLAPGVARRAMASARNIPDGGSLTVIATASAPIGGETTVIRLDAARTARRVFPAIDLLESGTIRPELLVGEKGAAAIAKALAKG